MDRGACACEQGTERSILHSAALQWHQEEHAPNGKHCEQAKYDVIGYQVEQKKQLEAGIRQKNQTEFR